MTKAEKVFLKASLAPKRTLTEQDAKLAKDYYRQLEDISSLLINKLSLLQQRMRSVS